MSSSELSNALNPHIVAQRPRRRHAQGATPVVTPAIPPTPNPHPAVPHRSELELAIAPPPPHPVSERAVDIVPPPLQSPRNAAPVVQQLYRIIATARDAATVERRRRISWEREQEAKSTQKQTEMEKQIMEMRQELSMLKTYISVAPNMVPPLEVQDQTQHIVDTLYSTARIEPAPPMVDSSPRPPMSPVSPTPLHPMVQQPAPMFIEGSSSRPFAIQGLHASHSQCTPPPTHSVPSSCAQDPPGSPHVLYPPTPQSSRPSSTAIPSTPGPETNTRKRPRHVVEDESDYDSETEDDSDTPPTDRPLKRKNGHDGRCLTIHHAMRIHIRKMMKLKHGEDLPESAFEGAHIAANEPVRFVWGKTTKQSATNATMKKRILSDIKVSRHKYKHVPEHEFGKKNLEAAFEQVFTTLRQKFKAQRDTTTATRIKRREDHKALKARRLHRKKTKLGNRSEARNKLDAFAQPIFDSALRQECMSSEESDGEHTEADGQVMQVFRTRGLQWRSARLRRFYAVLDEQDRFEKSMKPKRGVGRRVRREGPPKDGIFLPPKGVARWMVSRSWLQETEAMRPDLADVLRELIVDPDEPEPDLAQLMLGPDVSDDEQDQAPVTANIYAHVSETSYSLHNALQPV